MRPLARKVITIQYNLARTSLAALDSQASRRLPDGGRTSAALRRGIAVLDSIETRVLGVSDEASHGPRGRPCRHEDPHVDEPIAEPQEPATEPDEARADVSDGGASERSHKRSRQVPTERDRAHKRSSKRSRHNNTSENWQKRIRMRDSSGRTPRQAPGSRAGRTRPREGSPEGSATERERSAVARRVYPKFHGYIGIGSPVTVDRCNSPTTRIFAYCRLIRYAVRPDGRKSDLHLV